MNHNYPELSSAQKIWQEGIDFRLSQPQPWPVHREYVFHTTGVADSARRIAAETPYLNPEKAYVLGLLHDYGKKYDERATGKFHARTGYEELSAMGYDDAARICLTHSFPDSDFEDSEYASYCPEWLSWARQELKKVVCDDYDRLIQLCDLFFEGMSKVGFAARFAGIEQRYHLLPSQTARLKSAAARNKTFFDNLCGIDIYELLNISGL